MLASSLVPFLILLEIAIVYAALSSVRSLEPRDTTQLSASQIAAFEPYTQFARVPYCPIGLIKDWKCGSAFTYHFLTR
jgi:hypothetical protein